MRKITLNVPDDIRFISDWKDYELPKGHCIVDKGVTGCGYTEFCLTNNQNIVLCSPRKLLLENKRDQHKKDENILYLENLNELPEKGKNHFDFGDRVKNHIINCDDELNLPIKFMITYDSCGLLVDKLVELGQLDRFTFVVDEFQSVFLDSYFKASTEFDFVFGLQGSPNVIYLSATPMMDRYLEKVPEFKDLDFYSLIWSSRFIDKVKVIRKRTSSLTTECQSIINDFRNGFYPSTLDSSKNLVFSKEAVFFFNSIADITRIIKASSLTVEETNVLCSNTPENRRKLKRLGHNIGRIPLKGEPRKMFTFCTRSVYIGADFYSDNASTYVFADPNLEHLALDISLDLPQIVGRQRDRNNPFKSLVTLIYKTQREENYKSRKLFDALLKEKRDTTLTLLDGYQSLTPAQQKSLLGKLERDSELYIHDFVSISTVNGAKVPAYNHFIEVVDERAWEIAQEDFQDTINVIRALEGVDCFELSEEPMMLNAEKIVQDFLDNHFYRTGNFEKKMRLFCEFMDEHKGDKLIEDCLYYKISDPKFRTYYEIYGTDGCKARSFKEKPLRDGIYNKTKDDKLQSAVYNRFSVGQKLTKAYIKDTLSEIYRNLGLTIKAKASDITKYFNVTPVLIRNEQTKKRENGFKLESKCYA